MTLTDQLPDAFDPDALYEAFSAWADGQGLPLYPHQQEALIEVVSGSNVILSTPTGCTKRMQFRCRRSRTSPMRRFQRVGVGIAS